MRHAEQKNCVRHRKLPLPQMIQCLTIVDASLKSSKRLMGLLRNLSMLLTMMLHLIPRLQNHHEEPMTLGKTFGESKEQ
jgi:hypothetical protein